MRIMGLTVRPTCPCSTEMIFPSWHRMGSKPVEGKKLERWCNAVRARAENMLTSSLNTPAGAVLPSSKTLNLMMLPEYSATMTECVSDNDSERDGEDDDNVSENDLEIVGEQSGTADSTRAASGGNEAPVEKTKIILTEEEEKFTEQFQHAASKMDKPRKIALRHVSDRGVSMKKQGARKHDVKPDTLKKRLLDFPDQFLLVQGGQLYCGACNTNVGSCNSDARQHCKTMHHTTKVHKKIVVSQRGVQLL